MRSVVVGVMVPATTIATVAAGIEVMVAGIGQFLSSVSQLGLVGGCVASPAPIVGQHRVLLLRRGVGGVRGMALIMMLIVMMIMVGGVVVSQDLHGGGEERRERRLATSGGRR